MTPLGGLVRRKLWQGLLQGGRAASGATPVDAAALLGEGGILGSPFAPIEPPSAPLHSFVWENLDRWPDLTAVECGLTGRGYSYAELRKRCRRLAGSLRKLGVQAGRDTVSIVMPNAPEFAVALLGSLELGVKVNTINPLYTADEMLYQLNDVESSCIMCHPVVLPTVLKAAGSLPRRVPVVCSLGFDGKEPWEEGVVRLSELVEEGVAEEEVRPQIDVSDTAIIPYSSGTTGLPKGTCLTHNNITVNITQITTYPCDRLAQTQGEDQFVIPSVLPFFHCYGLSVLLLQSLRQGAKVVTLPKFEPKSFINSIRTSKKNTILYLVPPLVFFLGNSPEVTKADLEGVSYIVTGAAPCSSSDIETIHKKRIIPVAQGYGLTETSPVLTQSPKDWMETASVGYVVPNTLMKVLDTQTGQTLPANKSGELCFKGPQIMKGYLKNPKATEDTIDKDGWFHSGDIGYFDDGGLVYVSDRIKELIKVKGFQVAPAELEDVLRRHPSVSEAGVVGVPCQQSGEKPIAFISLNKGQPEPSEENLLKFVADKVAPFKKISKIIVLDAIPKTASGKILRKDLKKMALEL